MAFKLKISKLPRRITKKQIGTLINIGHAKCTKFYTTYDTRNLTTTVNATYETHSEAEFVIWNLDGKVIDESPIKADWLSALDDLNNRGVKGPWPDRKEIEREKFPLTSYQHHDLSSIKLLPNSRC
jgi:hypothetical protein